MSVAIDGVVAADVVSPAAGPAMAATLRDAAAGRRTTVIRGGGTKIGWGRPPSALDLVVDTRRLDSVLAHRHGDLTATIQAGTTLAETNRVLARHGQWLPVDSAFAGATIGGVVATNDAGPLRHRFGTPRDLLIGITLALTDGRVVKAGGTVVKNVAGYDLGRLMSGSFGSLAGIVDATFKLAPLPAASGTVDAVYGDDATLAADVATLLASQYELTAVDLRLVLTAGRIERRLMVCVASSPAATAAQLAALRGQLHGESRVVSGTAEGDLWHEQGQAGWLGDRSATLRCSWLPARLVDVMALVGQLQRDAGVPMTLAARAAAATGLLRIDGDDDAVTSAVRRLRGSGAVGNVVVLRASAAAKARVDVWGEPPAAASVFGAIKRTFDPAGILNAGRGPV